LESEHTIDLQLSESIDNATHEGLRVLDQTPFFGERGRDPDLESVSFDPSRKAGIRCQQELSIGLQDELTRRAKNIVTCLYTACLL
jgi:hypothetical protein